MKAIYKMNIDFGRMGNLTGVFVADSDDMEKLMGEEIYFGEVLGKHSDISATMEWKYFKLGTMDERFIKLFESLELESGFNPFDYVNEEE